VSVLTAVVALAALGSGVAWAFGADVDVGFWTLLNLHIGFGLLVLPLVILHLRSRYRRVRRVDFEGRRTALQYGAFLLAGALVTRLQTVANGVVDTPQRRFTGSKPVEGVGFPVTSWVADDPEPLDAETWRLRVDGLVTSNIELSYEEFEDGDSMRALLDCTSGWYTTEDWRGLRLGRLLDTVDAADEARWVTVHSVTGYRWSFPLDEARGFLLATHVDGDRLSHGHGFPLRLVAPDRRGFQWVKWVTRIELRRRRDATQYLATLVSGLA
jgi:DMSO/TMAO reductase YedYZ molybdopterin-dependent catalytic subunit